MHRLLFVGLFLPVAVLASTSSDRGVTGASRNYLLYNLRRMCIASRDLYFDRMWKYPRVFRSWREEVDAIEGPPAPHYFYERPVDTPRNSLCQPMNTTCCRPRTEKHIAKVALKEYGELFLNVTHENIGSCFTVGRHFYHAMYSNIVEVRRQLEIPINSHLDEKLPADLFGDFFGYLGSFLVASDICDLSLQLEAVMFKFFDFVYSGQTGESLNQTHTTCYRNISMQIMASTYDELFNRLERQLYNLDLIFRAMRMSEIVLQRLYKHRFSSECTRPLTQLQNCAHCTGYFKFKPCLFYCLNVLKGCFADVADIHREFRLMTNALSDIPDDILGTFQPEVFIKDSLIYLVHLAEDLSSRNLKAEVTDACSKDGNVGRKKRSPFHRPSHSSNLVTIAPTSTQEDDRLTNAFNLELHCMQDIEMLLGNIPEEMCYQSKVHKTIADTGNYRCWIGSRMGAYPYSQVHSRKEDQVDNPEFRGHPPPYLNQYDDLSMEISTIAAEINDTLDLVLCLDDEDCSAPPFYICVEDISDAQFSGSGYNDSSSGSGSGSGSSIDDGMRDMEDGDSSHIDDDDDYTVGPPDGLLPTSHTTPTSSPDNTTEPTDKEDYTVIEIPQNDSAGDNTTDTSPTTPDVVSDDSDHTGSPNVDTTDNTLTVPDIIQTDESANTGHQASHSQAGIVNSSSTLHLDISLCSTVIILLLAVV